MALTQVVLTVRGVIFLNDDHYHNRNADKRKFLAAQRSNNDPYAAGQWEFPGGKVEPGETADRGWMNECYQETGLLTREAHPLSWTYSRPGKNLGDPPGLLYMANFRLTVLVGGILKKSHEHEALEWVTFDEFIAKGPLFESWEAACLFRSCGLI